MRHLLPTSNIRVEYILVLITYFLDISEQHVWIASELGLAYFTRFINHRRIGPKVGPEYLLNEEEKVPGNLLEYFNAERSDRMDGTAKFRWRKLYNLCRKFRGMVIVSLPQTGWAASRPVGSLQSCLGGQEGCRPLRRICLLSLAYWSLRTVQRHLAAVRPAASSAGASGGHTCIIHRSACYSRRFTLHPCAS